MSTTSVRPRRSPLNSPCSSPRFSRKALRSPTVKKFVMPLVLVHGGASKSQSGTETLKIDGVKRAANKGYKAMFVNGGTALDAVEAAVREMEDDPVFNAGHGSSLTITEEIEMDALIMEGTRMRAGAVAGVTKIANPITLSKKIMEKSEHILLMGNGAHEFAENLGMMLIPTEKLKTEYAKERLDELKSFNNTIKCLNSSDHDTVGAVAVDSMGHVACATSTGGLTGKLSGRIGDTPCIGAGGYADDFVGAISTTGHGEAIMRVCLARHITGLMQQGMKVQDSVVAGLEYMKNRVQGYGGAIGVNPVGEVGIYFTTEHMAWAYRKDNLIHFGLRPHEEFTEDIS